MTPSRTREEAMKTHAASTWTVALLVCAAATRVCAAEANPAGGNAELRTAVEADWDAKEKRLGRAPGTPEAVQAALARATQLLDDLRTAPGAPDFGADAAALTQLAAEAARAKELDAPAALALYRRVRWQTRELALKNPLFPPGPLLFLKRHRFICQMLHEYLGYYYGPGAPLREPQPGGGVFILEKPGRSLATRDVVREPLPPGSYATLALSYDARTAYFAFCERAAKKPTFYEPEPGGRYFRLYAVDAAGGNARRLTDEPADDFDPCPLPDGGLAFMSIRRGGFIRCNNPWEPLPAYTLHRMDADGKNVRTLSYHETSEWHPSVLNDGRIVYSRWDYVDRSAANFHGLWTSNPDGTNAALLFGNYTHRVNACYQPRPIPGSSKIAFIAGAHHAAVGGSLVLLDPSRARLDPQSGEDRLDCLEVLTPEICFPEAPGWPASYVHSPWPLAENYYLISFSHDPLPGMSAKSKEDTETGLYYFDRFGNLELLYREKGVSCMYPIPLAPRSVPPVLPGASDPGMGEEGEFVLENVARGLHPLPAERPVKELRIFQLLPKTTHIVNQPRIGHANAEGARMLLGTVPVESDGSAYFRAPARKPLYFQAVDAEGRAVHTMRSAVYLQPGERRGCVGCHEPMAATPAPRMSLALRRGPSRIVAGPDGTQPFSYPRLIQPLLDEHCVRCHDGAQGPGKSALALTGAPDKTFTRSYIALKPFLAWTAWGEWSPTAIKPGQCGADRSRLLTVLQDANHAQAVKLDAAARRKLYVWLDGNVPFYGTYEKDEQAAQREGRAVVAPKMQ
jgi:hypothetical protein